MRVISEKDIRCYRATCCKVRVGDEIRRMSVLDVNCEGKYKGNPSKLELVTSQNI
jgi:hypothetical protein